MNEIIDVIVINSKEDLIRYFGNDNLTQQHHPDYYVASGPNSIIMNGPYGFNINFLDACPDKVTENWKHEGF